VIQMFPARPTLPAWIKIVAGALAVMTAMAVAAHQWDRLWSWLPWSDARRLERVMDQRDRLAAQAAVQAAHIEALTEQARRVETVHRQVIELRDLTDPVIHEARSAPDASTPLDPNRADRLREHDRSLCELASGACAGPAAAAAGVRPEAVSDRHPAGDADLGGP
jgi:hypothetical protein